MRRPEDSCCSAVASSLPDEVRLFCATSELILVLRTSDIACVLLMFPSGVGHQSVALFPGDLSVHPCRGSYRCAARELETPASALARSVDPITGRAGIQGRPAAQRWRPCRIA